MMARPAVQRTIEIETVIGYELRRVNAGRLAPPPPHSRPSYPRTGSPFGEPDEQAPAGYPSTPRLSRFYHSALEYWITAFAG